MRELSRWGPIINGLPGHGGVLAVRRATFLTFSDYMRPSIRLAALSGLHVVYVFTHDSIALGEDGPTHQSVEHLAALRAVPNLIVLRPGDANEAAAAWRVAVETRDRPVALVLSRQDMPTCSIASAFRAGVTACAGERTSLPTRPNGRPRLILIASGSEVGLIVAAGRMLEERKIPVRLVSMPSWELFEAQPLAYRESVLPPDVWRATFGRSGRDRRAGTGTLATVATSTRTWDRFGASAPGPTVLREYGFTAENVRARALALLGGRWNETQGGD